MLNQPNMDDINDIFNNEQTPTSSEINNTCEQCQDGYYLQSELNTCHVCPSGCQSCTSDISGTITCSSCSYGYALTKLL